MVGSPLKWHGGKSYLADRIVALMPPHVHYVEPFAGGLSVLLAKNPVGVSEVVNDLNGTLCQFWTVLREQSLFDQFRRKCEATPFSEELWREIAGSPPASGMVERAWRFFVHCRQSLGGRMKSFSPVTKTRTRRKMNNDVSGWLSAVEGLFEVHVRLKRVLILNRPALDVIREQDGPNTVFYLDPPYLHETRATTDDYEHEMSFTQHEDLVKRLGSKEFQGKFMLSGYRSELYDDWASSCGWKRFDFDLPNNAAGGDKKRRMTECVWCNFTPGEGENLF